MKPSAIRELTDEEMARAIEENQREALNLRLQAQTGQLENTARVKLLRRDLARLRSEEATRSKQKIGK